MPDTKPTPLDLTRAICHGMDETDADRIFFPTSDKPEAYEPAKVICRQCPVREACLEAALRDEGGAQLASRHGVFGGLDPRERMAITRKKWSKKRIKHGTAGTSGYEACVKRPEGACAACRAAKKVKDDKYRERAKKRMAEQRREAAERRARAKEREHGTRRGIQQHRGRREELCDECQAFRLGNIPHGKPGGAKAHRKRGEDPCAECDAAERAYKAQQQAERRARRKAEAAA